VWLLHDDCAPDPQALAALLRAASADPAAAVVGPKVVDWDDPRVLVEIGCTTDASGVRDTGLEPGELDQGQYGAVRKVLGVGTAGALVRRDVWDQLGGLDPELPLFRDDVDLGWRANAAGHRVLVVPQARVRHARAATVGERQIACVARATAAADRRAALQVLLANTPWLPMVVLRVVLSSLLRAAGRLLVRQPRAARDELTALLGLNPTRLLRARRARQATRSVPHRSLRPLMASPVRRGRARLTAAIERGRDRGVPTLDEPARSRRAHPGLLLSLTLAAVTVLAARALLGRGVLAGGPPAPCTAWCAGPLGVVRRRPRPGARGAGRPGGAAAGQGRLGRGRAAAGLRAAGRRGRVRRRGTRRAQCAAAPVGGSDVGAAPGRHRGGRRRPARRSGGARRPPAAAARRAALDRPRAALAEGGRPRSGPDGGRCRGARALAARPAGPARQRARHGSPRQHQRSVQPPAAACGRPSSPWPSRCSCSCPGRPTC
jgi:hypothetical protein